MEKQRGGRYTWWGKEREAEKDMGMEGQKKKVCWGRIVIQARQAGRW